MTEQLWDNGEMIGEAEVDFVDGVRVISFIKPLLMKIKEAAKADGINLTLAAGLRTFQEQMNLRHQNVIDKSKAGDVEFLKHAPSSEFSPVTGKPGFSNHHDGKAYDFNVTGKPEVYKWLVKNAIKFGFIRTVPSERWHFEYLPNIKDMFSYVPKTHETWDDLV